MAVYTVGGEERNNININFYSVVKSMLPIVTLQAFYDVFCDPTSGLIDCYSLLLYLCADPEPREGLCKALTVAVGGSPVTSLNPDSVNQDITILLEDFHKVNR